MSLVPAFRNIMVHMDFSPRAHDRVALACALADRFNGTVTGVAGEDIQLPIYGDTSISLNTYALDDEQKRVDTDLANAEAQFRAVAGPRNSLGWRASPNEPNFFLAVQARAADLVVISQRDPEPAEIPYLEVIPSSIVLEAGRPVLIAPPFVTQCHARRVLVAWKNVREARRAIHDSLPFIVAAEETIVLAAGKTADAEGAADVAAYLKTLGANASSMVRRDIDGSVADAILAFAEARSMDLIVTGAYGHSRMREWILGGVTRELIERSPVCCLMAH